MGDDSTANANAYGGEVKCPACDSVSFDGDGECRCEEQELGGEGGA